MSTVLPSVIRTGSSYSHLQKADVMLRQNDAFVAKRCKKDWLSSCSGCARSPCAASGAIKIRLGALLLIWIDYRLFLSDSAPLSRRPPPRHSHWYVGRECTAPPRTQWGNLQHKRRNSCWDPGGMSTTPPWASRSPQEVFGRRNVSDVLLSLLICALLMSPEEEGLESWLLKRLLIFFDDPTAGDLRKRDPVLALCLQPPTKYLVFKLSGHRGHVGTFIAKKKKEKNNKQGGSKGTEQSCRVPFVTSQRAKFYNCLSWLPLEVV